jgi:hypothetical protein
MVYSKDKKKNEKKKLDKFKKKIIFLEFKYKNYEIKS